MKAEVKRMRRDMPHEWSGLESPYGLTNSSYSKKGFSFSNAFLCAIEKITQFFFHSANMACYTD